MATKVVQASSVEPRRMQTSVTSSSGASTNSSKVNMFGVKSGFVIPKNKLSGSLVPIFRGGGKVETNDSAKEESPKQVQRKTKWGTDLTQDAAVRRGRILAYQTRVDQITQQLKSGVQEAADDLGPQSPSQDPKHEPSIHQADYQSQKLEMLELEKREAIGEIIKLNPCYKAPPDYKPLLKEAKVPIPLKLYPGYNFISLIMGPGSNTQKRLEEETGATIRIHGTKAGGAEKDEITLSDRNEVQSAYEELYVHVSADTFEKVDAAVALIELLVTPVPGNSAIVSTAPTSVSVDSMNVFDQSQSTTSIYTAPIALPSQGVVQPVLGSTQAVPPQIQFQPYRCPWFPLGPPHISMRPTSGFIPLPNSSAPMPNNALQFPQSPHNPSNMPPFLVGHPPSPAGYGLLSRNPSVVALRQQPPMQGLQQSYMPELQPLSQVPQLRNHPMPGPQPPPAYHSLPARPNSLVPHQVTGNQLIPRGPAPVARPPLRSIPPTAPRGLGNMMQMASPMVLSQRPHSLVPQPAVASVAAPTVPASVTRGPSAGNAVSTASLPSQPSVSQQLNVQVNHPVMGPAFAYLPLQVGPGPASDLVIPAPVTPMPTSLPSPALGPLQAPSSMIPPTPTSPSILHRAPSPAPNQSSHVVPMHPAVLGGPIHNHSANPILGSEPVPQQALLASPQPSVTPNSISGSLPSFTPIKPSMTSPKSIQPVTAPKPQRPSSGDFTFKPLGPQPPTSQIVSWPSDQSLNALSMPPKPTVQLPPAPQAPSYRPALHNSVPQLGIQGYPMAQPTRQMVQPQVPIPTPSPSSAVSFTGHPAQTPPRLLAFPNPNPVQPSSAVLQMGPRNFVKAPQFSNLPPRLANPVQLNQNQLAPTVRLGNLMVPNQQYNNNNLIRPASSPGNQVYDPFSPTSISSSAPQKEDNSVKLRKEENDPEYEDLMASVGVR